MANRYGEAFPVQEESLGGLTKLEYAAIHIVAGMVANVGVEVLDDAPDYHKARAKFAVEQAKALFDALP